MNDEDERELAFWEEVYLVAIKYGSPSPRIRANTAVADRREFLGKDDEIRSDV